MIQPKYNPKEALERIKLLMKYDTKKTLTENENVIKEQTMGQGVLPLSTAATGAAIGSFFPVVGTALGGAIGYGVGALTQYIQSGDKGADEFKKLMTFCSNKPAVEAIPRGLDDAQIRTISRQIQDAKGDWDDDEPAIVSALQSISTVSDLCAVDGKVPGGLYNFLDSVTDSPKEWMMFSRPVEDIIENSKIKVVKDGDKVTPVPVKTEDGKTTDTGKNRNTVTSKYKDCSGQNEPTLYCKNNSVVSKVQGCLGIKADGAFGPQTKGALEAKGLDGTKITQATVDKVCGSPAPKVNQSPFEDDEDDLTASSSSGSAPKTDDADELS